METSVRADVPSVAKPSPFLRLEVELLEEIFEGRTKTEIAEVFGVSTDKPGKWMRGDHQPAGESARLLMDLAYIWRTATADASPDVVRSWLFHEGNKDLGTSPLRAVVKGNTLQVASAWDTAFTGGYG